MAQALPPRDAGFTVPRGAYVNVCGTDLVRREDGGFAVLEDNLRVPSGVSYMLANREVDRRASPMFADGRASDRRLSAASFSPFCVRWLRSRQTRIVVLTPGVFNSAYFEQPSSRARWGSNWSKARDLLVHDKVVYMRTTSGLKRVDVIYRRIDDDFIDPLMFREDSASACPDCSTLTAPGMWSSPMRWAPALPTTRRFMPMCRASSAIICREEPILESWKHSCAATRNRALMCSPISKSYVVKAVGESGGYGMLVGPHTSRPNARSSAANRRPIRDNYIAQPTMQFSPRPAFMDGGVEPRHVDLRPFISWREATIVPGGLTRWRCERGSLVVNSSQGGGSKDTWVLNDMGTDAFASPTAFTG